VPALIEGALFEGVAEQLQENKRRHRQRARGAKYLLQGLLVCKHCEYALHGVQSGSIASGRNVYTYYRCGGRYSHRFGGTPICDNPQVRTDMLEEAVWKDVQALLADPSRVEQEYQRRAGGKGSGGKKCDDQLPVRIKKARQVVARLIDAYEGGLLERGEFEPRLQRARQRLEVLEAQAEVEAQDRAQQQDMETVKGHLEEFARRVSEGLQEASWGTRREIIRALVKRIEVGKEEVRVVYKVNPRPFVDGPERGFLQDRLGRGGFAASVRKNRFRITWLHLPANYFKDRKTCL
jgi:site-specific DNA recombinase